MPGPGPGNRAPAPKVKNPMKLFGRILKYVYGHYKLQLVGVLVGIVVSAVSMVILMMGMQSLVDDYIMPLMQEAVPDYGPLANLMKMAALVALGGVVGSFLYSFINAFITQGTLRKLRVDLFSKMESLPIKYFDQHTHGDIMSVYTNDVDTLRQLISQSLPNLISDLFTLIVTFISMLVLSVPLTLISVVMIAIMLLISIKLSSLSGSYFAKQQKELGNVNGYVEEMMTGQKVVKIFNHEEQSKAEFTVKNNELFDASSKAQTIASIMMPINGNLSNISYVLCAVIGCILALSGNYALTVGTLISFLTLNKSFSSPIGQLSSQMNSIMMGLAGAERIFDLLDQEPEKDDGYVELVNATDDGHGGLVECEERTGTWAWKHPHQDGTVTLDPMKGNVVFDDVDFGYTEDKIVLHHISMFAEPGQKIAFVGSTGAGKTTITNLINRFYDIQDGKIRYDNININKIKKSDLRRSLGMVLQDTHLFTDTIMENIRYGRLDATDEECIAAATLANADEFIRALPDGYQTKLTNDGSNLSQGQRQLIAIARAAVADPPVLILDEATSSIDSRTEKLVQQGMDALMYGRTTFVIAHRLSTVQNSDCIMVLENGSIIERGSHDDLIAAKGRYYQLYTGNKPGSPDEEADAAEAESAATSADATSGKKLLHAISQKADKAKDWLAQRKKGLSEG